MPLTRTLWTESPAFRRGRWLRFATLSPVAALGGGWWGLALGGGMAIPAGAGLFLAAAYLHTRLRPALLHWAEDRKAGAGRAASFLWDLAVVGGGGLILTRGLGLPWPPALSSALAVGSGIAAAFAWFFDQGGTRALTAVISPMGRHGPPRPPLSAVEADLAAGRLDQARERLEELTGLYPQSPDVWILLGRLLAGRRDDIDAGVRALEDGLVALRSRRRQRELALEILHLRRRQGEPLRALPMLTRLAERWGDTPEGVWARNEAALLKARVRRDAA